MTQSKIINFQQIKTAASGRWGEILQALTPLPAEILKRGNQDHPCPKCNGKSVIWPATDAAQTGSIACRKCTDNKPTGDGIATVAKWAAFSQTEAAQAVANYLGVEGESQVVQQNLIELVCKDKRMPFDAFMHFEPTVAKRGRNKTEVARVPVYNEHGIKHSYFDFGVGSKGWFARGEGMSGMFFPGRLPQPGETWHLVEGGKDCAALVGLGYLAAGLPTSAMADKYARLFSGCDIVLVPDLDTAGQAGAQKTGGRLIGFARSVRVARLPGEILEKSGDDVRDVLARKDGAELVRDAIENAQPWKPRDGAPDRTDGRPEVFVTLAYGTVVDQVTKHLGELGFNSPWIPEPKRERLKIYQRGDSLVQVVVSDDMQQLEGVAIPGGTARIRPLPIGQIPLRIADACHLIQEVEKGGVVEHVAVPPARWMIDGIASRGDWGSDVRRLASVITAPTIRPDGTILQQPGYDDGTGLLYIPGESKFPQVQDKPTQEDALKAITELSEVVHDFPFVDDCDCSAWLALVLSQIGRAAVSGCVPLFGITATTRGSGKSILADAASIIAYGRHAARKTFSGNDDEQRKTITAIAIEGLPSVLLDNVDCVLGGASIDSALTATIWNDRVLSTNKTTGELPLRTIWTATGNNLRLGSDLARRVLPIRLASQVENPEERTDFEHGDLLGWVALNRERLAVAALTILRAYVVASKPQQTGGAWGSFQAWSDLIRGAIVWTGAPDPLRTRETAKADDQSSAIVRGLIGGLLEVDETGDGITAREIVDKLNADDDNDRFPTMREVASEVGIYKGKLTPKSLGLAYRKYRGRVCEISGQSWRIDGEPNRNGVICWIATKSIGGYAGDDGCAFRDLYARKMCVTDTHETHTIADGDTGKSNHAYPATPADLSKHPCPRCGRNLVRLPETQVVDGWVNLDCVTAGCNEVMAVQIRQAEIRA